MNESTYMLGVIVIAVILFSLAVYGNYKKKKDNGLVGNIDEFFTEYSSQVGVMAEQAISFFSIKRSDFESDEDFMKHIIEITTDIVADTMGNFGYDTSKYPAMRPIIKSMIVTVIQDNLDKYITFSNEISDTNDDTTNILDTSSEIYTDIQKSLERKINDIADKNNS